MGCFKLPIGLCNEIETLIRKFWWGQHGERKKIHWQQWDELTKSKLVGGTGFRHVVMFNDSLLAKQAWKLLHNKDSLFYKVFKPRFFSKWLDYGGKRLKIRILCMEEYPKRKGCYPKGCLMADWGW